MLLGVKIIKVNHKIASDKSSISLYICHIHAIHAYATHSSEPIPSGEFSSLSSSSPLSAQKFNSAVSQVISFVASLCKTWTFNLLTISREENDSLLFKLIPVACQRQVGGCFGLCPVVLFSSEVETNPTVIRQCLHHWRLGFKSTI
ncbi:hypothetical protein CEXT_639221 [Caerostris extrusa]|uniref:Uncharacterized protein n=1 Tax=Caerostris extrusa TaxID=172846 RepID=A0AAV4VFQ0_CAEEX|nr:hypothetical protein CEXT_639221 [Caerostris extrusa]